MRIRLKCGSSSAMSIFPIVSPLAERLAPGVRWYLDRKAHYARFIDSQQDIASMGSDDIAGYRETESVAALLGSEQGLENTGHSFGGNGTLWINYVDSYPAVSDLLSDQLSHIAPTAGIDCVQQQVEKRLMHLGRVEISLEARVRSHVDRHSFIGSMSASDRSDVVQGVGEVHPRELHRERTCINQKIGGQPFETHSFFRRDREHL